MNIKNVELTPEMESSLRLFSPIKINETFEYVPKAWREDDIPKEIRPIFTLRPLSGVESIESGDDMRGTVKYAADGQSEMLFNHGKYVMSVCRKGIVGWKNYLDIDTGEEVPYEKGLAYLSPELLRELSNVILSRGQLSPEEVTGLK